MGLADQMVFSRGVGWSSHIVVHVDLCISFTSNLRIPCCFGCTTILYTVVMSWDETEGALRFYMFGEDLASAYVLCHQTSIVLEFWVRDR